MTDVCDNMIATGMAYLRRRANGESSCRPSASAFPIFKLPRELRDNIWEHALKTEIPLQLLSKDSARNVRSGERADNVLPRPDPSDDASTSASAAIRQSDIRASIQSGPLVNMLLLNKAQSKEYLDRAQAAMTLVLKDNEYYNFQPFSLPEPIQGVHYAALHIVLFCHRCTLMPHTSGLTCHATTELLCHQIWIGDLLCTLKKLKSLDIHIYICHEGHDVNGKAKLPCEPFVRRKVQELFGLPKLKHLTLCKYDWAVQPDLSGPRKMLMEWTAAEGVKELAPPLEKKKKNVEVEVKKEKVSGQQITLPATFDDLPDWELEEDAVDEDDAEDDEADEEEEEENFESESELE